MVPSQPSSANLGNSSKVEIPPEAINFISTPLDMTLHWFNIFFYISKLGPSNIPSFAISVQITY